ncbi:MAG TPA: PAS domain S-box protein [Nevskia sp.]|nr:PAS domain S-box protein [Nevskia sp.]
MDRAKEVQPESESFPPPASTGPGSTQRLPLPAAEAWLAAIIESSDDAIVSKTLQGIITSWNKGAERLFGFTAEEAVGQPIIMIIPPERQEEERLILQRLRSGERIEHFETIRRAKDGRLIEVSLTVSPIRDSSGRIVGASKIARDITLRKRAEATLREADRRKDAFIAILSHELRNPLAPVLHSTEVLLRDPGLGETARQLGGVILRQARYMARLIDDLLDSSRLDTGKVRLHKTRVELDAVVGVAVEINRARIDGQRLALKLAVPSGITLFADRDRLVQVLANLLNNAVKFTEPGGSIEIHAAAAQEWLVLRVRDTGIGIEPDKLGTIFDLFTQGEQARARAQAGLGIGLNVARKLVELHGGTLTAASAGPGLGSEFTIRLPLTSTEPAHAAGPAAAAASSPRHRRVLVVDDNEDAAETISALLRLTGHETEVARDGLAALEAAKRFEPEVVLLDLGLPRLSGEQVARYLREQYGQRLRLIAVTGWGAEKDRRATHAAGFDHHLVKPVSIEDIQALLD